MKYNIGDIVNINTWHYVNRIGIITNVVVELKLNNDFKQTVVYETIIAGIEEKKCYLFENSIMGKVE